MLCSQQEVSSHFDPKVVFRRDRKTQGRKNKANANLTTPFSFPRLSVKWDIKKINASINICVSPYNGGGGGS
jgi:hypothetical protein